MVVELIIIITQMSQVTQEVVDLVEVEEGALLQLQGGQIIHQTLHQVIPIQVEVEVEQTQNQTLQVMVALV